MARRINSAYRGALESILLLLPFALIHVGDGYGAMMLTGTIAPLFGLLIALPRLDARDQMDTTAIGIRTVMVIILYVALFAALLWLSEKDMPPLFKRHGWVLIPVLAPLLTAMGSDLFMKQHRFARAAYAPAALSGMKRLLAAGIYGAVILSFYLYKYPENLLPVRSGAEKKAAPAPAASPPPRQTPANSAFYDQYPYSPQVIRSIWIDLINIQPASYHTISGVYHSLGNLVTYKVLGAWASMPVFTGGPHTPDTLDLSSRNNFGHYNKDFVIWMKNVLIPGAEDSVFRERTQRWYDLYLKETARSYYFTYRKMQDQTELFDSARKAYLSAMASGTNFYGALAYAESEILFRHPSDSDVVKQHRAMSNAVNGVVLFWLRRSIDGTDTEFAEGLEKLLAAYDEEYLVKARSRVR